MSFLLSIADGRPVQSSYIGWITFQLGLFLLPSTAFLSGLLFLISIYLGLQNRNTSFLDDFWNWPFTLATCLMIVSAIDAYSGWLAWVGLANWLPFFLAFWGFQPYLITTRARRKCSLWLLFGTIPVFLTGLGQLWWGWEGPWQLLGGLIVWYISPGGEPIGRLSGLFDYANIAGAWLVLIWPLSLAALLQSGLSRVNRTIFFVLAIGIVTALILTDSRNAWGGLILAIPFVLGSIHWIWLLPLLVLTLLPVVFAVLPGMPNYLQTWSRNLVPESVWSRLNDMRYTQERTLASTRLSQWKVAIQLITEKPWFGWGAAAFSILYPLRTGQWHGHAHNLPLEMSVSYGLPVTLLVAIPILAMLISTLHKGILNNSNSNFNIFDRAWWTGSFILVVLHGTDMPFFDSRLNIAGWIFLAGMRCLLFTSKEIEKID